MRSGKKTCLSPAWQERRSCGAGKANEMMLGPVAREPGGGQPSRQGSGSCTPLIGISFHCRGVGRHPVGSGLSFIAPFCRSCTRGKLAARAHFSWPTAQNSNYRVETAALHMWPVPNLFPTTSGSSPRETCALFHTQPSPDHWEIFHATREHLQSCTIPPGKAICLDWVR